MFGALVRGQSAVRRIEIDSPAGKLSTVGAPVSGSPWRLLTRSQIALSDRVTHYSLLAAHSALLDAHIEVAREDPTRVGVAVGTSLGGAISQEAAYAEVLGAGATRLSPFTLVKVMYNGPAAHLGLAHGLRGPSLTYTTTCSSSTVAIGEACRQIRHGYADVMLAGGAEALFAYVSVKAWQALQVLAPACQEAPEAACRPFNRDRDGTVLGEGAAFVVLEEMQRAVSRGAPIYAELAGYGVCNDSAHMTQPSVEGQAMAMRLALRDANLAPASIDYINAHGTGTRLNDLTETRALEAIFGEHVQLITVSSTKSMHGHLVGASGALELAICVLAIKFQIAPPTAHLSDPDPECRLGHVALLGRSTRIGAVLSNSFAVGGTAASLIVRAIE